MPLNGLLRNRRPGAHELRHFIARGPAQSMMIFKWGDGGCSRIFWRTSLPFNLGMSMSRSTRSYRSSAKALRAASPSPASPQLVLTNLSISRHSVRLAGSSSTMSNRCRPLRVRGSSMPSPISNSTMLSLGHRWQNANPVPIRFTTKNLSYFHRVQDWAREIGTRSGEISILTGELPHKLM